MDSKRDFVLLSISNPSRDLATACSVITAEGPQGYIFRAKRSCWWGYGRDERRSGAFFMTPFDAARALLLYVAEEERR